MNTEDLTLLAERASTIQGRQADRLVEVRSRIRRARRRRQLGNVAAIVISVALIAGTAVLITANRDKTEPSNPSPPSETPSVVRGKAPSVRSLTYAVGQTIHVGDRTIDVGQDFWYLDATDDGVVFVENPPCNPSCTFAPAAIWFTDGSATVRIGHTYGTVSRGYRIASSNAGSILAWEELAEPSGGAEIVVYSTDQRRVVARFGVARRRPPSSTGAPERIEAVYGDYVYWTTSDGPRDNLTRYEVSTGALVQVSRASFEADQRSRPRLIVVGASAATGFIRPGPYFWRVDSRLVPLRRRPNLADYDYRTNVTIAFESRTGRVLDLSVPAGTAGDVFKLVQWLDDDRVVLIPYSMWPRGGSGDIFVCSVSGGTCTVAVQRSDATYKVPVFDS